MATTLPLRNLDIPLFRKFGIGFDQMFDRFEVISHQGSATYPPYNMIQLSESAFAIQLAVAGFTLEDIEVTVEDRILLIEGSITREPEGEFLHRGIATRDFTRKFVLADHVEVMSVKLKDGILHVQLERRIPDEAKPKRLEIIGE